MFFSLQLILTLSPVSANSSSKHSLSLGQPSLPADFHSVSLSKQCQFTYGTIPVPFYSLTPSPSLDQPQIQSHHILNIPAMTITPSVLEQPFYHAKIPGKHTGTNDTKQKTNKQNKTKKINQRQYIFRYSWFYLCLRLSLSKLWENVWSMLCAEEFLGSSPMKP